MHILVHDFAGHPFQAELSRELARRGHRVDHAYFVGDIGPKGDFEIGPSDAEGLSFSPLGGDIPYSKSNFIQRRSGDVAYGKALAEHVRKTRPDVIICGNAPTDVVQGLTVGLKSLDTAFVYWVQDFNGLAAKRLLSSRLPVVGDLVGDYYMELDKRHLRAADQVVHITEAFRPYTDSWGVDGSKVTVIPNWGAIAGIDVLSRDTPWAKEHGLGDKSRFLYSGTLALKHNPALITALGRAVGDEAEVLLVSAGVGADQVKREAETIPALRCLPLQPFNVFDQVLGSADVLLAVIENDAGEFSVPSKILSYLCAGKPIVLAAPAGNLAARTVAETGAGVVVDPSDEEGFVAAALAYSRNPEKARAAGAAGRAYAEANFDIATVASRFETVFDAAIAHRREVRGAANGSARARAA